MDEIYGPDEFMRDTVVSRETLLVLERYAALVETWQKAVNLVSAASLKYIWQRHVLDSAQIFPLLPVPKKGAALAVLDLGSGGGFPALILGILAAGAGRALDLHLVESHARKCAFLREAARLCGLDVTIHRRRLEILDPFPVDVITARGFAPLPRLLELAAPFFEKPGKNGGFPQGLFLKGRSCDQELTAARKKWNIEAETIPSISDPQGTVLRIKGITREPAR